MENIDKILIVSSDNEIKFDNSFNHKVEYIKEDALNFDADIAQLVIIFILSTVARGFLGEIGKDLYKHVKELIKKYIKNTEKNDNNPSVSFEINYKDYSAKFLANNITQKTVDKTLNSFNKQLNRVDFNKLMQIERNQIIFHYKKNKWIQEKIKNKDIYFIKKLNDINESDLDMIK